MKNETKDKDTTVVAVFRVSERLMLQAGMLMGVLLVLALFLVRSADGAVVTADDAAVSQFMGMRQFYMTESASQGDAALTACAPGYHMASLWEIADPTNLKYNTSLGRVSTDGGQGPPSDWAAWVRTGFSTDTSTTPGHANCAVWSTTGGAGTVVNLLDYWTSGGQDIGVWNANTASCPLYTYVWCVED